MRANIALIFKKLEHLRRMRDYLLYSLSQTQAILPVQDWQQLHPTQHETLAALRVRFSEYQEHLGKTMKAIAIEEEKPSEPFTSVLLYMEKLQCIESIQQWKYIRELRNAVNHEYEENTAVLSEFFEQLIQTAPTLLAWHDRLEAFCNTTYHNT